MTNINYSLSLQLGNVLIKKKKKLVIAESCTGGGLAEAITAVEGASQWLERGYVTYSNESKEELLSVSSKALDEHGAVSSEVAKEMAKGALEKSHADISISITGIAGPGGGTLDKPVGTVWFGLADREDHLEARLMQFSGDRKNVRSRSIEFALKWLLEVIL